MTSKANLTSILLMSDTHGLTKEIEHIIRRHETDFVIHCGDSELSQSRFSNVKVVRGNCDFDSSYPEELLLEINEVRIFVTHGHLLNVKSNLTNLSYRAEELKADIICFGHTHVAGSIKEGHQLFINPGSLKEPRQYPMSTYAILRLNDVYDLSFYTLDGIYLPELSKKYKNKRSE